MEFLILDIEGHSNDYIAICFVLTFIGTRLYNSVGKHIVKHLFKTPLHQYLGTMYPKPKTFK